MKKAFIFITIFVMPHQLFSQELRNEAEKKDNSIFILLDVDSSARLFKIAGEILIKSGYDIYYESIEFKIIKSKKHIKLSECNLNFAIIKIGNLNYIKLSGTFKVNDDIQGCIENKGMNGSPIKNAWTEMVNVSNKFPKNSKIFYGKI